MKFYPTPCWAQLHRRLSVHGLIVALVTVLLLIGNLDVVDGQTIGVDICACSPPTYKITFDFSLTCPPTNVGADGLASSSCLIGPFGDPNTSDFVPVFASEITFVEVGQDTSILVTSDITGDFANGSSIEYAALSSNPDRISNPNQVTRALRVTIIGTNAVGQDLVNVFILTFNNNCSVFPVIRPSENAGWAVFVSENELRLKILAAQIILTITRFVFRRKLEFRMKVFALPRLAKLSSLPILR